MTLTQLDYFVALAEHRSFSQAAKACGVTQPTLSAQFQKLEEELGHALVDRKAQPLVLTPMGQSLVRQAAQTVQSAETIKALVAQFEHPVEGKLRLGLVAPLCGLHAANWHSALLAVHPFVDLHWIEGHPAELQQALAQAELDAIITQGEGWNGQGKLTPFCQESWWALAPSSESKMPAWTDSVAWLMGSKDSAVTRFAALQGWKDTASSPYQSDGVLGRARMAIHLQKWVLLSESELEFLPPEYQKRAQRLSSSPRTLVWVHGMHAKNVDVQKSVLSVLQERLPAGLEKVQ